MWAATRPGAFASANSHNIYAAALILTWISLSSALIFQNKHILTSAPYPIALTSGHVAFAWASLSLLRRFKAELFYKGSRRQQQPAQVQSQAQQIYGPVSTEDRDDAPQRQTHIDVPNHHQSAAASSSSSQHSRSNSSSLSLDNAAHLASRSSRDEPVASNSEEIPLHAPEKHDRHPSNAQGDTSQDDHVSSSLDSSSPYWTRLFPAGVLFAASLVLSNAAYLYLSVTTIQIIKSGSPIAVMSASFAFGLREPTVVLVSIICVISFGSIVASYGALDLTWMGVVLQGSAIVIEATRLALTQSILHAFGFGPLESICATSPICLAALVPFVFLIEGFAPLRGLLSLGPLTILSNLFISLALNITGVFLIDLSSIILSLSKVVKDIMLIVGGTLILGEPLTTIQVVGYSIALVGLYLFKCYG